MPSAASTSHADRPPHRLRADQRRAEVIEAAVKAFASSGLAGTSTEDVARLAGVSQPYLFRLFRTKRELFLAAVDRMFERIGSAFEDAAHVTVAVDEDRGEVLAAIGRAYGDLLADPSLLRLQLHAYAACDDPVVRDAVRARFAALVRHVSKLTGRPAPELRDFFANGMLLNVAAAMDLTDADVAWRRICEGGPG